MTVRSYYDEPTVAEMLKVDVSAALGAGALPPPDALTVHGVRLWSVDVIEKEKNKCNF